MFNVYQPATIGAPPVAMTRDEGVPGRHLPGLTMHRIADLHAREAMTDARAATVAATQLGRATIVRDTKREHMTSSSRPPRDPSPRLDARANHFAISPTGNDRLTTTL
jgi:hypothetical protein